MEVEQLEARVKPLTYKVKAISRESSAQKASNLLESDLRSHWSTATNTKEWILLELDEPCLLSHVRIYNKSVLEWEIAVGLRYKPETFVKVRPRCEAPRREMVYSMNYTPCRYVRILCLRGNPIAIFFIQLIGITVTGLEPDFQPVVNHLLPQILSHKQDTHDLQLQLLQDMTDRLHSFLPQLEDDLASFSDAADSNLKFLAMLAGPFNPLLRIVKEREAARSSGSILDSEASRAQPSSSLTVSSNFEPRRLRNTSFVTSSSCSVVFRPDSVFMLLRKAYKDPELGSICRMASRILNKLVEPITVPDAADPSIEPLSDLEKPKSTSPNDYSELFGAEFLMPDDKWDTSYLNLLDLVVVEEGLLHVLYACASQPLFCSKLAENTANLWSALPLVQALLPALRPLGSNSDPVDNDFSQWKQPYVQQALSQIVAASSSPVYRPLLHACAGYLASYSPSHAKAGCVLIDLCSGVLAPWVAQVIAKVDLAVELVEDFLGIIQGARQSLARSRAALKCIVLALSGHMDDMLGKYKEVKHKILFLIEMLEPFLHPAITVIERTVACGDASLSLEGKQEYACVVALNVIRTAIQKPAVLPSLEAEWKRGSVAPSVLLSIIEPHLQLPPEVDNCKCSVPEAPENDTSSGLVSRHGGPPPSRSNNQDETDGKTYSADAAAKMDVYEDVSLFFAPPELQGISLTNIPNGFVSTDSTRNHRNIGLERHELQGSFSNICSGLVFAASVAAECSNLQADCFQLTNYRECELRASEFQRLAINMNSQQDITAEGHDAAVEALLLAAECYVNPFFMMSLRGGHKVASELITPGDKVLNRDETLNLRNVYGNSNIDVEKVGKVEKGRDKVVLQLLLEAANLDRNYYENVSPREHLPYEIESFGEQAIELSPQDMHTADAVTLLGQNQALLCNFLIHRLQREKQSMHEILVQTLIFLLHTATKLYCAPELVINIILQCGEYLNETLTTFDYQLKEGNHLQLGPDEFHGLQRRWQLLQKLVIASSGGGHGSYFAINSNNGCRFGTLIQPSAWMKSISSFATSTFPLVRFLGWMAVSRNAKQYIKDQLFLASDLSQLTSLLSIFSDGLAVVENISSQKHADVKNEHSCAKEDSSISQRGFPNLQDLSFHVIHPDLSRFFPNMKIQFEAFGEAILEAVGMQLRSLSSSAVPDVLCWFSDLCSWPFSQAFYNGSEKSSDGIKGYKAKNARAIILYILEAIVIEHMETLVPEMPRVVQVLGSLSRASYCDVSFLGAVLHLLRPLISYSLCKVSDEERYFIDDSCLSFESLCFDELFVNISEKTENRDSSEKEYSRALPIYILGTVFLYLSFRRKHELLQSLVLWADFVTFEPTISFHDYLCAFQCVMENCKALLVHNLKVIGLVPVQLPHSLDMSSTTVCNNTPRSYAHFLDDVFKYSERSNNDNIKNVDLLYKACSLSIEEMEDLSKDIEAFISKLNPTLELCCTFHPQLANKLTITAAECVVLSRCLCTHVQEVQKAEDCKGEPSLAEEIPDAWRIGLERLAESIITVQESHCWEVASVMLSCLLGVPHCFCLDNVNGAICSAIKAFPCSAPKIAWRLQTDKWLSLLCERGIHSVNDNDVPLVDLFCTLLGHSEPEQRFIALQHLGKLVGQDVKGEIELCSSRFCNKLVSPGVVSERILSLILTSTWDPVVLLASSDGSLTLRVRAMVLLVGFIPFAERQQLQSFLAATDGVLHGLGRLAHSTCAGPLIQLALALLAGACLYCPTEDIRLIPQNIWREIENIGLSGTEGRLGDLEKKVCQILCKVKNEGEYAKVELEEVLSSGSAKQYDPDFACTRESILQVVTNLSSVQSYFDIFLKKTDQEIMELEEAEMELDIAQKEHASQESSQDTRERCHISSSAASLKDNNRLQQIKDQIRSLEKSKLREDIITRRQRKLLKQRARQKYLEEAALREEELLQELDRERTSQAEKEIERQRLLELERAKTRELRYNLDMEKEKQTQVNTFNESVISSRLAAIASAADVGQLIKQCYLVQTAQRELQRDIEQAETGTRSRRDVPSSTHSGRQRDRYRERESGSGRPGNEGNTRAGSGILLVETSTCSSMTTMPTVLSGSHTFSGHVPTILQSRERLDECGSSYEENFDGSKDSGDTSSIGDADMMSAFDGQSSGFVSTSRHGSRGGKSRQVMDRRERDGRREGKWERKH